MVEERGLARYIPPGGLEEYTIKPEEEDFLGAPEEKREWVAKARKKAAEATRQAAARIREEVPSALQGDIDLAKKAGRRIRSIAGAPERFGETVAGKAGRFIIGSELVTLDKDGNVVKREQYRGGPGLVAKTLKPFGLKKHPQIKAGPTEESIRRIIEKRPGEDKDDFGEEDLLEEFLDFDPGSILRVSEEEVLGKGVLNDPFDSAGLFESLLTPSRAQRQIVETTPIRVSVPGGLQVTGVLRDSAGKVGYKLEWQGQQMDWFPEEAQN